MLRLPGRGPQPQLRRFQPARVSLPDQPQGGGQRDRLPIGVDGSAARDLPGVRAVSSSPSMVPLVLGAGGMLGRAVTQALEGNLPGTVSATRAEVDVTDRFRLEAEVERLRPDLILNCAAYTDVDGCEIEGDRARRVNAEGAENAARAAAGVGCPIVHISTDFVFDGRKGVPYSEEDAPEPLSEYGRSKYDGERRVAAAAPDHL